MALVAPVTMIRRFVRYSIRAALLLSWLPICLSGQNVITTKVGTDWLLPSPLGSALNAPLGGVLGVAVDSAGNLYIADPDNHVVVKVAPNGSLSTVAGNGIGGYSGDGGL